MKADRAHWARWTFPRCHADTGRQRGQILTLETIKWRILFSSSNVCRQLYICFKVLSVLPHACAVAAHLITLPAKNEQ